MFKTSEDQKLALKVLAEKLKNGDPIACKYFENFTVIKARM